MQCHKCQYNNKCDSHCLSCQYDEHYKYDNQVYFNEALEKPT